MSQKGLLILFLNPFPFFSNIFFGESQAVVCFCVPTANFNDTRSSSTILSNPSVLNSITNSKSITLGLISAVRNHIGPFATPKKIILVTELPKTRSGKIMRRILRKIASGDVTGNETEEELKLKLGDITTLSESGVVSMLIAKWLER